MVQKNYICLVDIQSFLACTVTLVHLESRGQVEHKLEKSTFTHAYTNTLTSHFLDCLQRTL